MKTLTTEQYDALPEEQKRYWKIATTHVEDEPLYIQVCIPLEDAERVIENINQAVVNLPLDDNIRDIISTELVKALTKLRDLKP